MPHTNVTVTATFEKVEKYLLTVAGGGTTSGDPVTVSYYNDGYYGQVQCAAGTVVTVKANSPGMGQAFDKWTSAAADGIIFERPSSSITVFTMPAKAVTVTATFKKAVPPTAP